MSNENNHKSLLNKKGQAVIEYMLVVVVTVAILIGLASQIFTPLQKFLQGFMGSYVECLLETGELPGNLGGDFETSETSECKAKLESTLATLSGSNKTGSHSSDGKNTNEEGDNENQSSTKSQSGKGRDRGATGSGVSGGRGGAGYAGGKGRSSFGKKQRALKSGGETADGTQSIPISESYAVSGGGGAQYRYIRRGGKQVVPIGRLSDEEIKELKKRHPQSAGKTIVQEVEGQRVKKIPFMGNQSDKRMQENEDKELSLSIGGFLRYLLIAAIIAAILVFVGRQAFQMSKSLNE